MADDSEAEKVVKEDVDELIPQAQRRVDSLKEQRRVAIQNLEVFMLDYAAMIEELNQGIDKSEKVLAHLQAMKMGVVPPAPSNTTQEGAAKERDEEQEKLKQEFFGPRSATLGGGPVKVAEKTTPVVPPAHARVGEVVTSWGYEAGPDWSSNDQIDEKNQRHVLAILCPEGHYLPAFATECRKCNGKVVDPSTAPRHFRLYDMVTGKVLLDEPIEQKKEEPPNGVVS